MTRVKRPRRLAGTTALNIAAATIALTAIASLVNNIVSFWNAVDQYVAQGYTAAEVVSGLLPSQLLPSLFESIAVYGGLAAVAFGLGLVNQRLAAMMPAVPLATAVTSGEELAVAPLVEDDSSQGAEEVTVDQTDEGRESDG